MSNTKIKLAEKTILSVKQASYNGIEYFEFVCTDGSTFNSKTRFNENETVGVFVIKYKGSLSLLYSHCE